MKKASGFYAFGIVAILTMSLAPRASHAEPGCGPHWLGDVATAIEAGHDATPGAVGTTFGSLTAGQILRYAGAEYQVRVSTASDAFNVDFYERLWSAGGSVVEFKCVDQDQLIPPFATAGETPSDFGVFAVGSGWQNKMIARSLNVDYVDGSPKASASTDASLAQATQPLTVMAAWDSSKLYRLPSGQYELLTYRKRVRVGVTIEEWKSTRYHLTR